MDKTGAPNNHIILEGGKGLVNIGSHPSNDLVIYGDDVLPFHMLIDYRKMPYRLIPLSPDATIRINRVDLSANESFAISGEETIDLGNNRLKIFPAAHGAPPVLTVAEAQTMPGVVDLGYQAEPAPLQPANGNGKNGSGNGNGANGSGNGKAALPSVATTDIEAQVILTALDHDSAQISVEQTAQFIVTVTNGSPLVSTFNVRVEGVPEEWVLVSPANVNLYEGGRAEVQISITPPHKPTSTAGKHDLRFVTTSFNHPDQEVSLKASLEILPYYDYAISDVNPRKKTIPWRKSHTNVALDVANRGNSNAGFMLTAQDEENGCTFQFVDNNGLKQPGTVEYNIPPGETRSVPVHISPEKRVLVALRAKPFPYRVVVTQPQNQSLSLFTIGTVLSRPLINLIGLILILLCLAGATFYAFTPRISEFKADNIVIGVGESTALRWKVPVFTHNLKIAGVESPVSGAQGTVQVYPTTTVSSYTLNATTWLWSLLGLAPKSQSITVLSVPQEPVIGTFAVNKEDVLVGDEITLRWSVEHADKVMLTIDGVTDTFEDPKDFNGERKLVIEKPTLIEIVAQNTIGSTVVSKFVNATSPNITIDQFEVSKKTIYTGEQVTISWAVSGVGMEDGGEVTISAFDSVLPLEGQMTFFPEESMEFVLTARNRRVVESRILPVGVLDPADPPEPPKIDFFTAAPDTLVGPGKVELAWSVSGLVDNITITDGTNVIAEKLGAQGFKTINVSQSGTYVMSATYSGKSAGTNLKITVNPALIKPELKITNVFPLDNLELGDTVTVSIGIKNPKDDDPPPTGEVIVTDGYSSCVITLPKLNCTLVFETPGDGKSLTATYQGDSTHVQTKSEPYSTVLDVAGNTITLSPVIVPNTDLYYFNQKVLLNVVVSGTNPSRVPDGELRIRRFCDPDGTYALPCTEDVIGYHKLTSADSGAYKFTNLPIDQFGGHWNLQVSFSGDSFYSTATANLNMPIDATPSPISLTATTTDVSPTKPAEVNQEVRYAVTVTDDNANAIYTAPNGTITFTATHTDGTVVKCSNLLLVPGSDGRTSSTVCAIKLTKFGEWRVRVDYKAAVEDIIHDDASLTLPGTLKVNSNVTIKLRDPILTNLSFGMDQSFLIDVSRSESTDVHLTGNTATDPKLTCAYKTGSGDGSCSCAVETVSSDTRWKCTTRPGLTDSLPQDRAIAFSFPSDSGLYLNSAEVIHNVSIVKANTVASLTYAPENSYTVGKTYTLAITASHANGGVPPSTGTITAQIGTGLCTDTGMGSGVIDTISQNVGASQGITFQSKHITSGSKLRICYRYDGNGSYNASAWKSSSDFEVTTIGTTASISIQPDQPDATWSVGETYNLVVNASENGGGAITTGGVTAKLGYGSCTGTGGMTQNVLATYTGTLGAAIPITFSTSHGGYDLVFCVRYDGNGNTYSASPWVPSNSFRVKVSPSWNTTADVAFDVADNTSTLYGTINVVLSNASSPSASQVKLVRTSDGATVCTSASSTEIAGYKCTYDKETSNGTSRTYTFKIGSTSIDNLNVKPVYVEDANNLTNEGGAFNLVPKYRVSLGTTSVNLSGSSYLWAYTVDTAAGETTTASLTGSVKFEHFTNYTGYQNHGLTATVQPVTAAGGSITLDPSSSPCSIGTDGAISCPSVRVKDSTVNNFKIVVTAADSSKFTGTFTNTSGSVNVIQNVIEIPNSENAAYKIKVDNAGCDSANKKIQKFTITGYAPGSGDPTNPLKPSDMLLQMWCEKNGDDDNDWDNGSWFYSVKDSEISTDFTWTTGDPMSFSYTITPKANHTYVSGCPWDADGVRFAVSLGAYTWDTRKVGEIDVTAWWYIDPANWVPIKDFEAFEWDSENTWVTDARDFDLCRTY